MVTTDKAVFYGKCLRLSRTPEDYKKIYVSSSLNFWKQEYRYFVRQEIYKSELIKIVLGTRVPLEIFFKIKSYLNLNYLV